MTIDKINIINEIGVKMIQDGFHHNFAGLITTWKDAEKYDCTPINTELFAFTGGDGVHFSYLDVNKNVSIIVMTVPANYGKTVDAYNIILAETFEEFLGLGYYKGWTSLDGYLYYSQETLIDYGIGQKDYSFCNQNDTLFLKEVISQLVIEPVFLSEERLKYLKEQYFQILEFNQNFLQGLNCKK